MNRPKLTPVTCAACGSQFQARASDVRRGLGQTCSLACRNRVRHRSSHSYPSTGAGQPLPQDVPTLDRVHDGGANQTEALHGN